MEHSRKLDSRLYAGLYRVRDKPRPTLEKRRTSCSDEWYWHNTVQHHITDKVEKTQQNPRFHINRKHFTHLDIPNRESWHSISQKRKRNWGTLPYALWVSERAGGAGAWFHHNAHCWNSLSSSPLLLHTSSSVFYSLGMLPRGCAYSSLLSTNLHRTLYSEPAALFLFDFFLSVSFSDSLLLTDCRLCKHWLVFPISPLFFSCLLWVKWPGKEEGQAGEVLS